jgi:hypothetical protein
MAYIAFLAPVDIFNTYRWHIITSGLKSLSRTILESATLDNQKFSSATAWSLPFCSRAFFGAALSSSSPLFRPLAHSDGPQAQLSLATLSFTKDFSGTFGFGEIINPLQFLCLSRSSVSAVITVDFTNQSWAIFGRTTQTPRHSL